jgi:2-dehydro-3-deoxygalactonokinase
MNGDWLAVDWGSTSVRAWRIGSDGEILQQASFELGVTRLKQGEAEQKFANCIKPQLKAETLPALLCGMVGSNRGWITVPYRPCPASLEDLRCSLFRVMSEPDVDIVPGIVCRTHLGTDVARGEETQVIGWMNEASERQHGTHVLCLPGTHSKWILVTNGLIERFVTAMSGELFDLLSNHSLLSAPEGPFSTETFAAGIVGAGDGDALSARLFGVRAKVAAGEIMPLDQRSYLSGLLIGAEVASLPRLLEPPSGAVVHLIGAPLLTALYARALEKFSIDSVMHDGAALVLAGLKNLHGRKLSR